MSQTKGKKGKTKSNSPTKTGNGGVKEDRIIDFDEGKVKMTIKTLIWIIGSCLTIGFFAGKYFEKIMNNIERNSLETSHIESKDTIQVNKVQLTSTPPVDNIIIPKEVSTQ